ncbi:pyridoxal-phosphate dependent enzyme [Lentzea sp. BCCO 10_0856]|uniref:Pyridoxal-phosphate dependent enzyme n=1 Tax=Lentzea miocenica TaxID=3095431 RepID=A0ABU4STY2_9PSEU|nr:pyridoxal-phosphate dependent enzyme [Lentzea sp. BCCO 10_0856]MDX8029372.1 pyridoxal-phosphate dependent enzyme [Lentzea sp. BCCO 10_0856]
MDPTSSSHTLHLQVPSPLSVIRDDRLTNSGIELYLKRDDLISDEIPGNKWRKLKYNIEAARREEHSTLLTFGGAYSNHIRAVASAGVIYGFKTIGIIRGEEHASLNWSLARAEALGMRLEYVDRTTYRNKKTPQFLKSIRQKYGNFYLIPEGGSNDLAVKGCVEIPQEILIPFDLICCPCGTGGTLAGISMGIKDGQHARGFAALKGASFLDQEVSELQRATGSLTHNWRIEQDYHFGGFAKRNAELTNFIHDFSERHGIQLEWTYVAKMMYGIFNLAQRELLKDSTVVAVITGPAEPAA